MTESDKDATTLHGTVPEKIQLPLIESDKPGGGTTLASGPPWRPRDQPGNSASFNLSLKLQGNGC
jgi:hypothetical protein